MKKVFPFIIIAIILLVFFYTFQGGEENYAEQIQKEREKTTTFMRTSSDSPFADTTFTALNYFPPNPAYKVTAHLHRIEDGETLQIATTDGGREAYTRYAYAEFTVKEQDFRLLILRSVGDKQELFIPFADETSGETTYGGGRYLNLDAPSSAQESITIDFNLAYNPYCAYNPKYVCPIPPRENFLNIPIEAGEKTYH
jgi:uncharacterized protein